MATSFQLFPCEKREFWAPAYGFDPLSAFRGSTLGETHCNPHGPHATPRQKHLAEMKIRNWNRTISMETYENSFYWIHFSFVFSRPAAQMFYIIRSAT